MFLLPRHLSHCISFNVLSLRVQHIRLQQYSLSRYFSNMDTIRHKMSALTPFAKKHKVTVIGSGNW
jgi:hypothetical protein